MSFCQTNIIIAGGDSQQHIDLSHIECVRLRKYDQYIFSVSLKFGACYITSQWVKFTVKNAIICLHIFFWYFLLFFIIKFVFLSFLFLFLIKSQIFAREYLPIRNLNWWFPTVSRTVCIYGLSPRCTIFPVAD